MLLMKKRFFDAIRCGRKTTTVRYWRRRRTLPGSVHTVPGLGKVLIRSARAVRLADLTGADARADGFASRGELRDALQTIYPDADFDASDDADGGAKLFLIHFTLLDGR